MQSLVGTIARTFLPGLFRAKVLQGAPPSQWQPGDGGTGGDAWWLGLQNGAPPTTIDEATALTIPIFWACVSSIAMDVAKVPVHLFRKLDPAGRETVPNHPAYQLLLQRPNPWMEAVTFRENGQYSCNIHGNFYAEIVRDAVGNPKAMWPLRTDCVDVLVVTNPETGKQEIKYRVRTKKSGTAYIVLDASDVFHVRGLGNNGLKGLPMLRYAAEMLTAAKNMNKAAGSALAKGGTPRGVLEHPRTLSADARQKLRDSWEELHAGADPKYHVAILQEGMQYKPTVGVPMKDLQLLESRQWSVIECCQVWRIPPHKVFDLSRAHFDNIEHGELAYISDTLLPWWLRWEQQAWAKLLRPEEQATHYFKHSANALLRTDFKTRMEGYKLGVENGIYNRDEVREWEDLNPVPDGSGQMFTIQVNQASTKAIEAQEPADETKPSDDGTDATRGETASPEAETASARASRAARTVAASLKPVVETAIRAALGREVDQVRKRAGQPLEEWADRWYTEQRDRVASMLMPAVEAAQSMLASAAGSGEPAKPAGAIAGALADRHCARSREQLKGGQTGTWGASLTDRASVDAPDLCAQLAELAAKWRT